MPYQEEQIGKALFHHIVISSLSQSPTQDRKWLLTVSGLLLIHAFIFILRVNVFCLSDPVQIAFEILFQLLLLSKLLKISPSLGLLSLFGKLSGERAKGWGKGAQKWYEQDAKERWR